MGAQLVKSVASKTNDIAGDGTTTATVLARAIYREGCKAVAAGMNPLDVRRGISAATTVVVDTLTDISRPITSREEVSQVGTISANNDAEIGGLISDAMERVGKEGVITVQDGKTIEDELEVVEGMRPGMSATVDIITAESLNALSIPIQSLTSSRSMKKGTNVVFVYNNNIVNERVVDTGIVGDRDYEILSGLEEGEQIVTGSFIAISRELTDGMKVKVREFQKNRKRRD